MAKLACSGEPTYRARSIDKFEVREPRDSHEREEYSKTKACHTVLVGRQPRQEVYTV